MNLLYNNVVQIDPNAPRSPLTKPRPQRRVQQKTESIKSIKSDKIEEDDDDEEDGEEIVIKQIEVTVSDVFSNQQDVFRVEKTQIESYLQQAANVLVSSTNVNNRSFPLWETVQNTSESYFYSKKPYRNEVLTTQNNEILLRPQQIFHINPSQHSKFRLNNWNCVQQGKIADGQLISSLIVMKYQEEKTQELLFSDKIYPQDEKETAIYNPNGNYRMKVHFNGAWRASDFDDKLPCAPQKQQNPINSQIITVSHSINPGELWVSLFEKGYLNIVGEDYNSNLNMGMEIFSLSRWIPDQSWNIQMIYKSDKEFDKLQDRMKNNEILALVSIPRNTFTKQKEEQLGLEQNQTYALLKVTKKNNQKMMMIRNPHRDEVYKGNQSITVQNEYQSELQQTASFYKEGENINSNQEGTFSIDADNAMKYFKSGQIFWNPAFFPHSKEFHFTWEPQHYMISDNDLKIRYAPQFKEFPIGITMYLYKHEKLIKTKTKQGQFINKLVGDPSQQPSSARIYSNESKIISTNHNTSYLKVLNVGIRDKYDLYDIPNKDKTLDQVMQEQFADFVGYFTTVMQINPIPKEPIGDGQLRFSLYAYSNEPIQFAQFVPIHQQQERSIVSIFPSKPMMNFAMQEKEIMCIEDEKTEQQIDTCLLKRKSGLVNVSVPITSKAIIQQYFLDENGKQSKGLLEIFQRATQQLFSPQYIFFLTPDTYAKQYDDELYIQFEQGKPIGNQKCTIEAHLNYKLIDNETPHIIKGGQFWREPDSCHFYDRLVLIPQNYEQNKKWSLTERIQLDPQKVGKRQQVQVVPFLDLKHWENRDEYRIAYVPPLGYDCKVEFALAPWQSMKYELCWNDKIQQSTDNDNEQIDYSDDDSRVFDTFSQIDEEQDDDFYNFKQFLLGWRYSACTLPSDGNYILDICAQGQKTVNYWAFIWSDKFPVQLLSLGEISEHPTTPKLQIFPINTNIPEQIVDKWPIRPMVQNLEDAKIIKLDGNEYLMMQLSQITSKQSKILSKDELIKLFSNDEKAFLYYLSTVLLFGPQYDITFIPKQESQKFGADIQINAKFTGSVKGTIITKLVDKEQLGQIIKTEDWEQKSENYQLINRNADTNLIINQITDYERNIKVNYPQLQNNKQMLSYNKTMRIYPMLEFSSVDCRQQYKISLIPPNGYDQQVQKVPSVWEQMKYETVWEDSVKGTTGVQINDPSNYKYRFCIIRTEQPTDIFIQILAFGRTNWGYKRQPSFKVAKLEEKLNDQQEIKHKLDIFKSSQVDMIGTECIFSSDNRCLSESIMLNQFKYENKDIISCFPCAQSRLPNAGNYLLQFQAKGQDVLTMIGYAWSEVPIKLYHLLS
ncbi:MAG: putative cysteine proteinase [Streblomastix strix]|uniref:Putative cysteine proteinase n=1 Tax=Streblomastix strix TaxID=222440 RepID=A0A5J4VT69_9EUKA|nr:MAG: putative cysteine proteinase [Streblomastix strix]